MSHGSKRRLTLDAGTSHSPTSFQQCEQIASTFQKVCPIKMQFSSSRACNAVPQMFGQGYL